MKRTMRTPVAALAIALVAAVFGGASATQAAPKPGFLPGTWNATGKTTGVVDDGFAKSRFVGSFRFKLVVKPDLTVTGTGSWLLTMRGSDSESVGALMRGVGTLKFAGTASDVRFTGQEQVKGAILVNGESRPITMSRRIPNDQGGSVRLVVTRPGKCRVLGTIPMGSGVTAKWTAELAIRGTCNA